MTTTDLTCPCIDCVLAKGSKKVFVTYENGTVSRIRIDLIAAPKEPEKKIKWNAKFTDSEAAAIKKEYDNGAEIPVLSEKYGVKKAVITRLVKGMTYNRGGTE